MSKLTLTTRILSCTPRHVTITVFQNGGNAGNLIVDAEHGEAITRLIAAAPELLEICESLMQRVEAIDGHPVPNWLAIIAGRARVASAKATGTKP